MLAAVEDVLRAEGRFAVGGERVPLAGLALVLCLAGFLYGAAMGSFS